VPAANRIGEEGQGFKFAMSGLDGGRINIGACSLGAAWCALDKARQYMLERKAFGRQIADFQGAAVQDRRHGNRARGRPPHDLPRRRCHRPRRSAGLHVFRHGQALGHRLRLRGLQHRRCRSTAATAISRTTAWKSWCGILRVHQILEGTNEIMRVVVARKVLGGNRG
jgi:alkylation response protein AidB-like acyl-CoA dehydrogenase